MRGETAARDARDDVDFIEQTDLVAFRPDHLGAAKEFQNAVGKGRGAGTPAGEGKDDQVVLILCLGVPRFETVGPGAVDLRNRHVDRAAGATGKHDGSGKNEQKK